MGHLCSLKGAHSGMCGNVGKLNTIHCYLRLKETRPKSTYYEFMQIKFKTRQN